MHLFDASILVGDMNAGELEQAGAFFPRIRGAVRRKRRGRGRRRRRALRRSSGGGGGGGGAPRVIIIRSNDDGGGGDGGDDYEDDDGAEGFVHVGSLPAGQVWTRSQFPVWDPRGIGDFRTSNVYSNRAQSANYQGDAIPTMVGDLSLLPSWTYEDHPTWDPRGIGDFRTTQVYSGRGSRQYRGEAIPTMVGDLGGMTHIGQMDESGIAFMLGAARRRRKAMEAAEAEVDEANEEASEGMMLIAGPAIGFIR